MGKPSQDPRLVLKDVREQYQNHWQIGLPSALCEDPMNCCFGLWCPCCVSYMLRKQLLYHDLSRYLCCGGACPCSGKMGEKDCPEFCLCLETVCCFTQSVASTRFMIQDEQLVENTKCDTCIIGTMMAIQYVACICDILAMFIKELEQASDILNCIADLTYCTVCACMQTQHKVQLDVRDGLRQPKEGTVLVAPPCYSMQRPGMGGPPGPPMGMGGPPQMMMGAPQQQPMYAQQAPPGAYGGYGAAAPPPQGYPQAPPQGYPQAPPPQYAQYR